MKPLPLKFQKSAASYTDLPPDTGFEIILSGYSNVGKSSIINAISNNKSLAKCSKTPGRTQLFNLFSLDDSRRILDLPGYGFAKVSNKTQQSWAERLGHYLGVRQSLKGIMIITDIRRGLRPLDIDIIDFCHENSLPVCVVLNKSDKLSKQQALKAKQVIINTSKLQDSEILLSSCSKKTGVENIIAQISSWLSLS